MTLMTRRTSLFILRRLFSIALIQDIRKLAASKFRCYIAQFVNFDIESRDRCSHVNDNLPSTQSIFVIWKLPSLCAHLRRHSFIRLMAHPSTNNQYFGRLPESSWAKREELLAHVALPRPATALRLSKLHPHPPFPSIQNQRPVERTPCPIDWSVSSEANCRIRLICWNRPCVASGSRQLGISRISALRQLCVQLSHTSFRTQAIPFARVLDCALRQSQ